MRGKLNLTKMREMEAKVLKVSLIRLEGIGNLSDNSAFKRFTNGSTNTFGFGKYILTRMEDSTNHIFVIKNDPSKVVGNGENTTILKIGQVRVEITGSETKMFVIPKCV
ncbi:MAG TPA: hypothetical protein PKA60_01705 [Candidatus Paceibacterota bacterium]|nr:hypothetical protein [Candidatus Paceibacterota bacterium]